MYDPLLGERDSFRQRPCRDLSATYLKNQSMKSFQIFSDLFCGNYMKQLGFGFNFFQGNGLGSGALNRNPPSSLYI